MTARKRISFSRLGRDLESHPSPSSTSLFKKESHDARRTVAETESVELRTKLQKWITEFVPTAVKWWLCVLVALILFDSINVTWQWLEWFSFDIETPVMAAIVGSTTIAIVGLVHSAIKGIFGKYPE